MPNVDGYLEARSLFEGLRARYAFPEWLLEEEVQLGERRVDAIAYRLWGGGIGHQLYAFEVKRSRQDWLRELENFRKSESAEQIADAFWVVAPAGLVKPDELPLSWGLLELHGETLRLKNRPPMQTAPSTLPRAIAARYVTRIVTRYNQEQGHRDARERDEIRKEIEGQIRADATRSVADLRARAERAEREHLALCSLLTGKANGWHADHADALAIARRLVFADYSARNLITALRGDTERVRSCFDNLTAALRELEAVGSAAT